MARLSASRAYAQTRANAEEKIVRTEGVMDSEEEEEDQEEEEKEDAIEEHSTLKRRRLNADARHANDKESRSSHQHAMGQGESREEIMKRKPALHRAGQETRAPQGKLPRISGGPSHARPARRPLANANTYNFPDDFENDVLSNSRRTPIQRTFKQTQNARYVSPEQAQLDGQLGFPVDEEEAGAEQDEVESQTYEEGAQQDEVEIQRREEDEPVVEQPQQSGSGKKRPGRPPKQPLTEPSTEPPEQMRLNGDGKRKRGRPSKQKQPEQQTREPLVQASTSAVKSSEASAGNAVEEPPTPVAAPRRKPGRPTKAAAAAEANQVQHYLDSHLQTDQLMKRGARVSGGNIPNQRRSARVSGGNTELATKPRSAQTAASRSVARQPANNASRAATSSRGRQVSAPVTNHNDEQQNPAERVGSMAQPLVVDDDEQNDEQAHDANEEPDENDEPEEDDAPEPEVDESEERPEAPNPDAHRLHGQWGRLRGITREAAKHRDEVASIPDDTFTSVLSECRKVRRTIRTTAIAIGPDELNQITSECRSAVSRAEALCRDTSKVPNRDDRGYHIFKFLIPALARLLKAVVEAFERVDIEGAGQPQISTNHLVVVINLAHAIYNCGNDANRAYTRLDQDRPIKRAVHNRITVPLRDLHAELTEVHERRSRTEAAREQAAIVAQEIAANNDKSERIERQRATEKMNADKWRKMNNVRLEVGRNSWNLRKQNHLRSCGSALVETDGEGRPFLPAHLRNTITTFTMRELVALEEGLIKHVDTPSPLESEVFENIMIEYCQHGKELAERNTLEIVRSASDMRHWLIHINKDDRQKVPRWVWLVPAWMDPLKY